MAVESSTRRRDASSSFPSAVSSRGLWEQRRSLVAERPANRMRRPICGRLGAPIRPAYTSLRDRKHRRLKRRVRLDHGHARLCGYKRQVRALAQVGAGRLARVVATVQAATVGHRPWASRAVHVRTVSASLCRLCRRLTGPRWRASSCRRTARTPAELLCMYVCVYTLCM